MSKIIGWFFLAFFIIFIAFLVVELVPSQYLGGFDRVRIVSDSIKNVAGQAWDFSKPLLQLLFVLAILELILIRTGVKIDLREFRLNWDIRSLIAVIVVIGFVFAALSGVSGLSSLKDVALVVVGFYFGGLSQKYIDDSPIKEDV